MPIRRVINESEVSRMLSRYGFSTVRPETLSFEDQVKLFHDAKMVVAAHGSGMSNILFSGSIRVLDLQSCGRMETFFSLLAQSLNQDYRYLICESPSTLGDFTVDIPKLEDMVKKMLSGGGAGRKSA